MHRATTTGRVRVGAKVQKVREGRQVRRGEKTIKEILKV